MLQGRCVGIIVAVVGYLMCGGIDDAHCETYSLYAISVERTLFDVDQVVAGTSSYGRIVRKQLPSAVDGEAVGNALAMEYAQGTFYLGTTPSSGQGKLFRCGFTTGDEAFVGELGYYNPNGMTVASNGDVYVSFAGSSGGAPSMFGRIDLETGEIIAASVEQSDDTNTFGFITGLAFAGSNTLLGVTKLLPSLGGAFFALMDAGDGTTSPRCDPGNVLCWQLLGANGEPYRFNGLVIHPVTGEVIGVADGVLGNQTVAEFYRLVLDEALGTIDYELLGVLKHPFSIGGLTFVEGDTFPIEPDSYTAVTHVVMN